MSNKFWLCLMNYYLQHVFIFFCFTTPVVDESVNVQSSVVMLGIC